MDPTEIANQIDARHEVFKGRKMTEETKLHISHATNDVLKDAMEDDDLRQWLRIEVVLGDSPNTMKIQMFVKQDLPPHIAAFIVRMREAGFHIENEV